MKFTAIYAADPQPDAPLLKSDGFVRVLRAVEEAGFDALGFTEHPAPSQKWMAAGGHATLDVAAALGFAAAATTRIRLMNYLLVVPYHNPFAAAKALTTIDLLSSGRLTVVAGTGYLRSEFLALGADFDNRNQVFDEALEVMRGVWSNVPFSHKGVHFEGREVASLPRPVQPGGPPLIIGGNGSLARRRAARLGGWSPMLQTEEQARTTRTPAISTIAQLAEAIAEVRAAAREVRPESPRVEVQVEGPESSFLLGGSSLQRHRDHLEELATAGVDSFVVKLPGESLDRAFRSVEQYAADVLSS